VFEVFHQNSARALGQFFRDFEFLLHDNESAANYANGANGHIKDVFVPVRVVGEIRGYKIFAKIEQTPE